MQPDHPVWRALVEALPYAVYAFDAAGVCVFCRDPLASVSPVGRQLDELSGRPFDAELRRAIEETIADRAPRQASRALASEDGEEQYIDARIQPVQGDGCLLLYRDTTATMREERVVRDERELFRNVLDNDPNLIFVKDRLNRFVLVNRAVGDVFETTPEQLIEVHNAQVNPNQEELAVYERVDREVLTTGNTVELEESITRPNGEQRWYRTRKSPLRRESSEVQVLGISVDITEQRRALAELIAQHKEIVALSAPILEVWEGVLAVPVIGTLTAERSERLMDSLLAAVSGRRATHVIIDLTGTGDVDAGSADRLARMSRAIRLLGAEAVLAGLRPELAAAAVVHSVDLGGIPAQRSLRTALQRCIEARRGRSSTRGA